MSTEKRCTRCGRRISFELTTCHGNRFDECLKIAQVNALNRIGKALEKIAGGAK